MREKRQIKDLIGNDDDDAGLEMMMIMKTMMMRGEECDMFLRMC